MQLETTKASRTEDDLFVISKQRGALKMSQRSKKTAIDLTKKKVVQIDNIVRKEDEPVKSKYSSKKRLLDQID